MPHRTYLLLSLIASANALTDNFVDGQCATNDGEDHFPHKSEAGDQFADVISADYSLLWEVQYENDYKIVKNTKTGTVHVLHQCGLEPPSNEELPAYAKDGTMVEVPLTKIATTSTTYLAFLEMLGERKALKSYQSSFQYVSSPCLRMWPAPAPPLRARARTSSTQTKLRSLSPSHVVSACNSTFTFLVSHNYSTGLATRISRHIVSFHIFSSALAKRSLAASPPVPSRTRREPSHS